MFYSCSLSCAYKRTSAKFLIHLVFDLIGKLIENIISVNKTLKCRLPKEIVFVKFKICLMLLLCSILFFSILWTASWFLSRVNITREVNTSECIKSKFWAQWFYIKKIIFSYIITFSERWVTLYYIKQHVEKFWQSVFIFRSYIFSN